MARAASIAAAAPLAGKLIAIGRANLTIQTRGSQATISTTATTNYYQVASATAHSLTVGQTVAVSTGRSAAAGAAAVVITPPGLNLIVFVLRSGRLAGGGPSTGGGDDGGGGDGGGSRGVGLEVSGRITALSANSITILPLSGAKTTMTLNASTTRYRLTQTTRAQLRTGSYVATRASLGGSAASDVVEASSGTTISIGASISGQSSGE